MAVDLQTVLPQDVVPVSRSRLASLGGLLALDVIGEDFRSVDEVRINDIHSPDFIVIAKNRLIAQLPETLQNNPDVSSIQVLSRTLTLTNKSLLRFRIGDTPGQVQGILRLLQLFVKLLLSAPGTDIFNKNLGGGALRNVGVTFNSGDGESIKADFVIAIDRVARQIVSMQSRNGSLPRDERLLNATLKGATFDRSQGALFVVIEVVSQTGASARANLEL